jgi:hypothetical protein
VWGPRPDLSLIIVAPPPPPLLRSAGDEWTGVGAGRCSQRRGPVKPSCSQRGGGCSSFRRPFCHLPPQVSPPRPRARSDGNLGMEQREIDMRWPFRK